jgi:hypothetical protein
MSHIELSAFISITIEQVLLGIKKIKLRTQEENSNTIIAPGFINGEAINSEQNIEFEIFTETEIDKSGQLKIFAISGSANSSTKSYHKVKFIVPVLLRGLGRKENLDQ